MYCRGVSTLDRPFPLEPSGEILRQWTAEATERVIAHLASLERQPAFVDEGGEVHAEALRGDFGELPEAFDATLDVIFESALHSFNTAHPGYFAYVPGGGVFPAALADFISNAINRYVGVVIAAPGLARLEQNVIDWMLSLARFDLDNRGVKSGGVLLSGGSLANFSAMIAARRKYAPEDLRLATVYASREVHHSMTKAAMLAGIPIANVRAIDVDAAFQMQVDALAQSIENDRAAGFVPTLVCASAGTTNTGAIDPLRPISEICRRHSAWMHVDAAYGGFFLLTERGRLSLDGIGCADSITLDPHKGLFLPYGTGALLVKDREDLRRGHAVSAAYLPTMLGEDDDAVDFCELSPELSRGFRGLRVWLALKLFGVAAFREALDEKIDLARRLADRLKAIDGVELIAAPQLSLLAFRLHPPGVDDERELTRLNQEFLKRINASHEHYLTPTTSAGRFLLRVCVLHFRSHAFHVDRLAHQIECAAGALRADDVAR